MSPIIQLCWVFGVLVVAFKTVMAIIRHLVALLDSENVGREGIVIEK